MPKLSDSCGASSRVVDVTSTVPLVAVVVEDDVDVDEEEESLELEDEELELGVMTVVTFARAWMKVAPNPSFAAPRRPK